MAAPLPPVVEGPLNALTKLVHVENVLPDAVVTVYENGAKVGAATSSSPGSIWVPLTHALTQGGSVTATQSYETSAPPIPGVTAGAPSDPSNAIPVLPLPDPLPSPVFLSWMTTCTNLLYMGGLIPGCTLRISLGATTLIDTTVSQPSEFFTLPAAPSIPQGAVLEAQQAVAGRPSSPVTQSLPVALPGTLTAPELSDPPLLGCETAIAFSDMTPGADLRIVNHGNVTLALSSWPSWTLIDMTPLQPGPLTAQQSFERCRDEDQRRPGPTSTFTVAKQAPALPVVPYAPCTDVKQLTVTNLVPGEILTVSRVVQGQPPSIVGVQGVAGASATVNLPQSFKATDPAGAVSLEISVTLCGVPSAAPGYTKVPFPPSAGGPYPAPKVRSPLYDCARAVQVLGVHPGSLIQVFSAPHGLPCSNAVVATTADPVVQLWSPLTTGEAIFVKVSGCNAQGPSPEVPVKPLPSPFEAPDINGTVVAGAPVVDVTGVYQGAQVYLFVDGVFRSHVDSNELASFDGPVSLTAGTPPLKAGDSLHVVQTLCDDVSSKDSKQGTGTVGALFVRREIHGLEASETFDPITLAYAEAVKVMQQRPMSDPTSWRYQAAMHGTYAAQLPGAEWNLCQHGGWFFLPWHRMYMYFFERIVRAAVYAAGGPNDFAIPYWNYNRPSPGNTIPPAFRTRTLPNGEPNPLCLEPPERAASYMAGAGFDPSLTSPAVAEADTSFTSPGSTSPLAGFGGAKVGPKHPGGAGGGDLEFTPHGVMHTAIGGTPSPGTCGEALMSLFECAALDPIFWLHHGNIDRLWTNWIASGGGRVNPPDPKWQNEQFFFHDETGAKVAMTAAEVLDTATQLSYIYDDAPGGVPTGMIVRRHVEYGPEPSGPPEGRPEPSGPPEGRPEPSGPPELVAASEAPLTLAGDPASVHLSVPDRTRALVESAVARPGWVLVTVDDIKAETNPGVVYGVYLNLPAQADVERRRGYHVGNLSLFGIEQMSDPDVRHEHAPGFRHRFDATRVVSRLAEEGRWDSSDVAVTFQPIEPLPPPGEAATWDRGRAERSAVPPVEIGRVALFVA